jgi:hypothetical protein
MIFGRLADFNGRETDFRGQVFVLRLLLRLAMIGNPGLRLDLTKPLYLLKTTTVKVFVADQKPDNHLKIQFIIKLSPSWAKGKIFNWRLKLLTKL